ncbi:hypothetical protein [Glutamicibacter arilaitensis]|uniref:hypothetical protein n=1 Tax=Glutamicibacter arilaitensis TaxID=256701 RepID=UPI003F90FE1A
MKLTFVSCATDGLQKVHSPIQISGSSTVAASNNYMSCPKCGRVSRLLDFDFAVDTFGRETINYLLTPDVLDTLSNLKGLAQRMSFQELNTLYEFYTRNQAAFESAPPTIRRFFAALKGQNAMAIATYVGLLISILTITGVIGSSDLSAEEIVDIVREYDATHPEPIQEDHEPRDLGIAPEMVDPPETLGS